MTLYDAFPQQLKTIPNWVCWRSELRNNEFTKIPYNPLTGSNAKANTPTTWSTFQQAVDAMDVLEGNGYDGIGFEFLGTHFAGIDFDNAIKSGGVVDPYALAILEILGNPYTETSPSGTGLHAYIECASLPEGKRKLSQDHTGIEIYHGQEKGRFFTVTGARFSGNDIPKIDDIMLPYLLITQNRDAQFRALWLGETTAQGGDDSKSDFALMCRLARLTQNDPTKMEKYFSASALGQRDKWTDRPDYRQSTITKAIAENPIGKPSSKIATLEFQTPALPDCKGDYVIAPAVGQKDGWFPLGDISLIGGASGTGKTTWLFQLLSHQKQGYEFLGHGTFGRLFHVLAYDRRQNSFERTMDRLNMLPSDVPSTPLPLAMGIAAVQTIIDEIEKLTPIPSVVLLEGLDMLLDDANKKSVVAPFMRHLQDVAAHFHIALIGSVGAPKSKQGEAYAAKRDKISGSEAWGRNCETVVVIEFSEDDDGTDGRRQLTVLPRNAKAEKFTMEFQGGRLVQVQPTEEDVKPVLGRPDTTMQVAIRFLETELQAGPRDSKELLRLANDQEGITRGTFYGASRKMKIIKHIRNQTWELAPMHEGVGDMPDMGDMESVVV